MKTLIAVALLVFVFSKTHARQPGSDSMMITVFLQHQEDKNPDSVQHILDKNNSSKMFLPKSARVVSWYVMMGGGQVVTVKIPVAELRTLNLSIEKGAWGAYNTKFYPTYDYLPVWEQTFKKQQQ